MENSDLHSCVFNSWSPTLGDPSPIGWITVIAYATAALLSAIVLVRGTANRRTFWYMLTVVLVLLAINKQLDLQSALTAIGRCTAKSQGWYENRRAVQLAFILVFSLLSLTLTLVLVWKLQGELRTLGLALFGLLVLITFVIIRAAGFHHFDRFIGAEVSGVRMNWILELTGILLISLNAILLLRGGAGRKKYRRSSNTPKKNLPFRREL